MKKKSLSTNALLSVGQKFLSIIFPLITFPYISRVLIVEDIGKINFTSSIISYFVLVAGLGISNYATREGAKLRENHAELDQFCSEIFSINIFSTFLAYILLLFVLLFTDKLQIYSVLLLIQSFLIIGSTIGVNWIYAIEEDYFYITIRTFLVQLASLILMFLFVKSPSDYIIYAIITVFANVGANVFTFIHSKKYVKIKLAFNIKSWKKHIKPILMIFASSIAVTIYVESDITLLGILCGEYSVGLYSRSTKIYTIIKQMITSLVIVALPNLSNETASKEISRYIRKANDILYNVLLMAIPIGLGLCVTAKQIMIIAAGGNYIDATLSLSILGISIIFASLSSYLTYCCLLPLRLEKVQMFATIISAILNIGLNFILLPIFQQNGAAFTTLISEFVVFAIEFSALVHTSGYNQIYNLKGNAIVCLFVGALWIVAAKFVVSLFELNIYVDFFFSVILCSMGYFIIMKVGKYPKFDNLCSKILTGIRKVSPKFFN